MGCRARGRLWVEEQVGQGALTVGQWFDVRISLLV